jgi:hypothetical protein
LSDFRSSFFIFGLLKNFKTEYQKDGNSTGQDYLQPRRQAECRNDQRQKWNLLQPRLLPKLVGPVSRLLREMCCQMQVHAIRQILRQSSQMAPLFGLQRQVTNESAPRSTVRHMYLRTKDWTWQEEGHAPKQGRSSSSRSTYLPEEAQE